MFDGGVAVLIPAYKPDARLNKLIDDLRAAGFEEIVVVDDGGGADYAPLFERARAQGARVLVHEVNRGKGAALKTGLKDILRRGARPVVTCDSDGQHAPEDIKLVADALLGTPDELILGARDKRLMPLKSKMGNSLTCFFLGVTAGLWISDTQTGLRGLPAKSLAALSELAGDRYEYETNVLIEARRLKMRVREVVITTLYFDNNAGSHFRPLKDGLKIYRLLFGRVGAFIGSSAVAAAIDFGLFTLLHIFLPDELHLHMGTDPFSRALAFLLPASIGVPALIARAVSSLVNYFVNRNVVFKAGTGRRTVVRYYLLVAFVLLAGIQIIRLLTDFGVPTLLAKVLADGVMFIVSYFVQNRLIFVDQKAE